VLQPTGPATAPAQPLTQPAVPAAGSASSETAPGWPCTSCKAVVPLELNACPECGAAFLSLLAGDSGRHRSATSSEISRFPRSARLAAGVAAGILLALLVPLLLALLG
jgi:hypothetical protein